MAYMDALTAFVVAFAVTAAGGAAAHFLVRASATAAREQRAPDGAAWRETHRRRAETFAGFVEPAEQIGYILKTWPVLSPKARRPQREAAREHLRTLERRQGLVALDSGPDVQAAAQQLLDACTRLVHGLDVDAPPGPADTTRRRLTMPFLDACREYLDAESEQYFGLRRPAGRSLFARLWTR